MDKEILKQGIQQLELQEKTLIIIKKNKVIFEGENRGISDLLNLYTNQPELLDEAFVIDKIIGKAAAFLCVMGNVKEVYGLTMSESAIQLFEEKNMQYGYKEKTEKIINRMKTGMCPIESAVYNLHDEKEALQAIKSRLKELTQGK